MTGAVIAARLRAATGGRSARALARAVGLRQPDSVLRLLAGRGDQVEPLTRARICLGLGLPWDFLLDASDGPTGPGRAVWAARLARGLDLRAAAQFAGMAVETLRHVEAGGWPASRDRVLRALG